MKKLILLFLIFLNISAYADVMPYYSNSLRRYGIGYTRVQSPVILRREAKEDGEILEKLNFDYKGNTLCEINKDRCPIEEIFAAYSESKKIALLTTLDETESENTEKEEQTKKWSLVCFNQAQSPICGWVEEKENNKFYNWSEFFEFFGRKHGLYLFKDLKKPVKILYSAPMKQTNSVGSVEMPRAITPWLIRGNWILVKIHDFNNQFKTGWINFRGDDGKLKLFVKF